MKPLVYIIEDDADIAELVQFNLELEGYNVYIESNGDKAYEKIIRKPPDILLLDLTLPGLSGIEICKYLRETPSLKDLPIIMITARSQEFDKIYGLKIGADDYITKPFSVKELSARINALLRRAKPGRNGVFEFGNLKVNFELYKVYCKNKEIKLTPKEFNLLKTIITSKGRVLSRSDLLDAVWGIDNQADLHTVNVAIKRLRDKLKDCNSFIQTVQGIGYRFKIEDE